MDSGRKTSAETMEIEKRFEQAIRRALATPPLRKTPPKSTHKRKTKSVKRAK